MSKQRKKKSGGSGSRGRHTYADVTRDGDTMTLEVDLARADLPSQEYEADVLWAMVRYGAVSFVLDRLSLRDPSQVEARVEVRMPFESFLKFVAATQADAYQRGLLAWLEANPVSEGVAPIQRDKDPEQPRAALRANVARVSYIGSDAEVSFYAMPASHVSQASQSATVSTIPIVGVLRVTTTTYALARLLSACPPLVKQMAPLMIQEGSS
jgi:hypothetical protein